MRTIVIHQPDGSFIIVDLLCAYCRREISPLDLETNNFVYTGMVNGCGVAAHLAHLFRFADGKPTAERTREFQFVVELMGYLNAKENGLAVNKLARAKREKFERHLAAVNSAAKAAGRN